jgi:predicted transcriptional regulator
MKTLKTLEQFKASLRVLFYLLSTERDEVLITEIINNVDASGSTIYNTIRALSELKLVKDRPDPPKRWIRLTPKGKEVAQKIKEINEILSKKFP